jgi:hypothetical protein
LADNFYLIVQDCDFKFSPPAGMFWPYLNKSGINLTGLQIFDRIDPTNYKDNCFVYACIMSGQFTDNEIEDLRMHVRTRKVILDIADRWDVNFKVYRIREDRPKAQRFDTDIFTSKRKTMRGRKITRDIPLLLYKEHGCFMVKKFPSLRTMSRTRK